MTTVNAKKAKMLPKMMLGCAALMTLGVAGCAKPDAQPAEPAKPLLALESDGSKASYTLGYGTADDLRTRMGDDFDEAAFLAGVEDAISKAMPQVTQEEGRRTLGAIGEKARQAAAAAAEENVETGKTYLAENAEREGVTVLESGLQYEVLTKGEGDSPGPTATVTTHYEGRLIDGTVFDSSIARGEPASFPLNRVIPGWTEALQLMKPGSKWRLYIPSELAYGQRATGSIPANSTLIFDVELISVDS
ncbi:MAG: FKBP-type peptidyl-prolyl cis-trans isomerase [Pseudomonadota bacterium]